MVMERSEICIKGDCLKIMPTLPGKSFDFILCDLPYGRTQNKWDCLIPFNALWQNYERLLKPSGCVALFGIQPFTSLLVVSNLSMYKYDWIWKKTQAVGHLNAWRQPMRDTETISIFCKGQSTYNPQITDKPLKDIRPLSARTRKTSNYGDHDLTTRRCPIDKSMPRTVIEFANAQGVVHPTQKPVPLLEYLIQTYTNKGDSVLDNCMGSGSTGIACVNLARKFTGIEKDEKYFQIAKKRIRSASAGLTLKKT